MFSKQISSRFDCVEIRSDTMEEANDWLLSDGKHPKNSLLLCGVRDKVDSCGLDSDRRRRAQKEELKKKKENFHFMYQQLRTSFRSNQICLPLSHF